MIAPGALVILTPVVVGTLFGTRTLSGLLAGSLVSGVQMAVSMSNTGGAWDNAKKYVEVRTFALPASRQQRGTVCMTPPSTQSRQRVVARTRLVVAASIGQTAFMATMAAPLSSSFWSAVTLNMTLSFAP